MSSTIGLRKCGNSFKILISTLLCPPFRSQIMVEKEAPRPDLAGEKA